MIKSSPDSYRKDIDGIRAIAVLSVFLFHLGFLPNGYLGVDIFFAISGYLITKIVFGEVRENRFSITNFYLRRIRRIIPLVLFTTLIALIIGLFVMLPDDLENLSQSVFATNFFANNILLLVTTGNYWAIVNDFKPLMHTWSLGVEEQFYLFYPILFLFLNGKRSRWTLHILLLLTICSIILFFATSNEASKFYSIQFRFFELSLGGIGAVALKNKLIDGKFKLIFLLIIILILFTDLNLSGNLKLLITTFASVGLLISASNPKQLTSFILENKLMVAIGKISFSLYMWHQIVLAFTRYFVLQKIDVIDSLLIFLVTVSLSVFSYLIIEQPFRNKQKFKTRILLISTGTIFLIVSGFSLYVFSIAGVVRNVPELDIYAFSNHNNLDLTNHKRNIHIQYNAKIYDLEKTFTNTNKTKILVIGNSFARDWANVLLESKYRENIEISYIENINIGIDIQERLDSSQYIFFSEMEIHQFKLLQEKYNIDSAKVWNVGTKNFGSNNGIYYNKRRSVNYCSQRTKVDDNILKLNSDLKKQWGGKYIDLLGLIMDKNYTVPIFTSNCKFISQDCNHLTKSGAIYFAKLIDNEQSLYIK